jgi:hypothetical protein
MNVLLRSLVTTFSGKIGLSSQKFFATLARTWALSLTRHLQNRGQELILCETETVSLRKVGNYDIYIYLRQNGCEIVR